MSEDAPKLKLKTKWKLVKWDGDPPGPGEHKEPIEVIEGEFEEESNGTDKRI